MIVAGRDWANDADIDAPEYNTDFDENTRALAEKVPVAHSKVGRGYWIANGFDNVRFVSQNYDIFDSKGGVQPNAAEDHYVSLPHLVAKKLTGRWVPFPALTDNAFWVGRLRRYTEEPAPEAGSCIAFVCEKMAHPPVK